MKIIELVDPKDIKLPFKFHNKLNPALWRDKKLKYDVKKLLEKITDTFIKFVDISKFKVVDVIITGSNANYNWTDESDIDLHLVIDLSNVKNKKLMLKLLQTKRFLWNYIHNITINGYDVEIYIQYIDEPHVSSGVYSILSNKWIVKPKKEKPKINDLAIKHKVAYLMNKIDDLHNSKCMNIINVENLKEKIRKMRKSGLNKYGIYSYENLSFKILRNSGYLDKLHKCYISAQDKELSK